MKTIEQINEAADKLGAKVSFNKKSFNELPKHIKDNEMILGIYDAPISLVVITNERFLRVTTSMLSPTDIKEVYLKNISNIEIDAGFLATRLLINSAGGQIELGVSNREMANKIKSDLNEAISNANKPAAVPQLDVYAQLEKIAELKEKGILTEAEFQEQKAKLLSQ